MSTPVVSTLVLFPGALGDLLCCWPALDGLIATGHALTLAARSDAAGVFPTDAPRICSIERRELVELFATAPLTDTARRFFAGFDRVDSFTGAAQAWFVVNMPATVAGTCEIISARSRFLPLSEPLPVPRRLMSQNTPDARKPCGAVMEPSMDLNLLLMLTPLFVPLAARE